MPGSSGDGSGLIFMLRNNRTQQSCGQNVTQEHLYETLHYNAGAHGQGGGGEGTD